MATHAKYELVDMIDSSLVDCEECEDAIAKINDGMEELDQHLQDSRAVDG